MMGLRKACEWIAFNDEPTDLDVESVSGIISVVFAADIYGKTAKEIAERVVAIRILDSLGTPAELKAAGY